MNFINFRNAVNKQFNKIAKSDAVFVVDIDKNTIWDHYLASFPEGTNPMYRERTEHDCSCCKNFIRNIGIVVGINKQGNLSTVWDISLNDEYQVVADSMRELVSNAAIACVYRTSERKYGLINNTEMLEDGSIHTWEHFHADLPRTLVMENKNLGAYLGDVQASFSVFKRSLEQITSEAIDIVEDLIRQKSLYRGQEHKTIVSDLKKLKAQYDRITDDRKKELFLWMKSSELGRYARFKNTVIGTLLSDLSDGVDLETAVSSFEKKVAPENYKRPTALITQSMIDGANKKVKELGIEDSLHRRFANIDDLTINNVLFADRESSLVADATPLDDLLKPTKAGKKPNLSKVQEISIEDFIKDVMPTAESMEVLVENRHTNNLVSLIAPVYPNTEQLLKWDNGFSWSYAGEVTDSIKERVKKAGGSIVGDVRVSLSWFNYDDLDLHADEPGRSHLYFGNKRSSNGGHLDVDMNAGGRNSREPVENIVYRSRNSMKPGKYSFRVNNFTKRENVDVGFEVEVEINGVTQTLVYDKAVTHDVNVIDIVVDKNDTITYDIGKDMKGGKKAQEVWGITTEQFQKVKTVMLSPNHWDDNSSGNKHYFFILEDCVNPEDARGMFNEFLRPELNEHRKVFELLGSKMKAKSTPDQLSGLGFSETKNDHLMVKVSGSMNRVLKVNF